MSNHCSCPSCHKYGAPASYHKSSCCFTPDVSFRKKNIKSTVRERYCSSECEIKAFRLFKKTPQS